MPPMTGMVAPLAIVLAVCNLAMVAVVLETRAELGAVRDMAAGPHRNLLEPTADDSVVTVARMNKAIDHLQETLGSRLTAVERQNAELKASMKLMSDSQTGTGHGSRARSHSGGLLNADTSLSDSREAAAANVTKKDAPAPVQGGSTAFTQTNSTQHRRAQAAPQACVRVADFQALTAAAMDACCPHGGGHRRLQASCDLPAACPSAACAAVFVPYMQDCAAMLEATPGVPYADFQSFAASCAELQAGAGQMLQPVATCRCSECWSTRRARRRLARCCQVEVLVMLG